MSEMLGTTTSPLGVTTGTRSSTNSFEVEGRTRPSTLDTTEALVNTRSYLEGGLIRSLLNLSFTSSVNIRRRL